MAPSRVFIKIKVMWLVWFSFFVCQNYLNDSPDLTGGQKELTQLHWWTRKSAELCLIVPVDVIA